jgi:hypothetical protein
VVGQRKGPSGANAPPVHGIKKCLDGFDVPYSEALVMSKLHKLSDHRSHLCDEFFNKIVTNPNDKLHGLNSAL